MERMKLGLLPPVYDSRNLLYAVRSATPEDIKDIPEVWDGLKGKVECLGSQGSNPTCGGWAGAGLLKYLIETNDRMNLLPSAGAIYDRSRYFITPPPAEGTSAIAVMKCLQNIGGVPEWCAETDIKAPFEIEYCDDWESEAHKWRIGTYREVPVNVASIKAAIWGLTVAQPFKEPTPLFIAVPVWESFFTAHSDGVVPMPTEGEKYEGGHAMLLRGWPEVKDDVYWACPNSWGKNMGDSGIYYLPLSYPIWQCWLATDDKPYRPDDPEPEPPVPDDDRPGCSGQLTKYFRWI